MKPLVGVVPDSEPEPVSLLGLTCLSLLHAELQLAKVMVAVVAMVVMVGMLLLLLLLLLQQQQQLREYFIHSIKGFLITDCQLYSETQRGG